MGIRKCENRIGWGSNVWDHLSLATEFVGDNLSRGIDLMGFVSPGGQEAEDRMSGDQMGLEPNVLQHKKHGCFPRLFKICTLCC